MMIKSEKSMKGREEMRRKEKREKGNDSRRGDVGGSTKINVSE